MNQYAGERDLFMTLSKTSRAIEARPIRGNWIGWILAVLVMGEIKVLGSMCTFLLWPEPRKTSSSRTSTSGKETCMRCTVALLSSCKRPYDSWIVKLVNFSSCTSASAPSALKFCRSLSCSDIVWPSSVSHSEHFICGAPARNRQRKRHYFYLRIRT